MLLKDKVVIISGVGPGMGQSMAKLAASEIASRVVDRCVQMMGRWGLESQSKIERLYRQARPMRIYEGSSEVLRLGIAKQLISESQQPI